MSITPDRSQLPVLSYAGTVELAQLHRRNPREAFLTDAVRTGDGRSNAQDLGLLRRELLVGEDALRVELRELLQLSDIVGRGASRWRRWRGCRRWRGLRRLLLLVGLRGRRLFVSLLLPARDSAADRGCGPCDHCGPADRSHRAWA